MNPDGIPSSPTARRPDPGEVALLQLVNSAYTTDDLRRSLDEAAADPDLAPALMHRRGRIGAFRTIDDIADVEGLDAADLEALAGAFGGLPAFDPDTETLEYVVWTHGSALTVQHPERFGQIDHRATGLRLHSGPQTGWSNDTAAIATPAYALGKQFRIRSVLISVGCDPEPFAIHGIPMATPTAVTVWDEHHKMASTLIDPLPAARYVRVPTVSSHKVRTGIAVLLDVIVLGGREHASRRWLEINAVGAEFVTRSGGIVAVDQ